jgi:hypothetical protein
VFFHCIQHYCNWFCHWPTAAVLSQALAVRATPRPSHGRLRHSPAGCNLPCHGPSRQQPPMPRSGLGQLRPGWPCPSSSKAVVGHALAATGCTKVVADRALAVPMSWLVEAPQSTHESSLRFWTTLILVICSFNKMVIPLFTKFTYVTYIYQTIKMRCKIFISV